MFFTLQMKPANDPALDHVDAGFHSILILRMLYATRLSSHAIVITQVENHRLNVAACPIGVSHKGFCVIHHKILRSAREVFKRFDNALNPELLTCQVILEMTPTSTKELPPPLQGKKSAKGGSAIENSLFYRDSIARELFDNI